MRWSVWLLVAVLAVAGVVAACGGGASEREVGSQRPEEQEAGSGDGAAGSLAGALGRGDDQRAAPDGSGSGGSEGAGARARWIDPVAEERAAAAARSSNALAAAGLGVSVWTSDDAIRITVSPTVDSLTVEGPGALRSSPIPLPLQMSAGLWNCAVGLDHPAPDEAEGRLVVTFADFDEAGSEVVVEAAEPEWSGEARLDVVGIVGSLTGRHLTATIVSDFGDGMWRISCQLIDE